MVPKHQPAPRCHELREYALGHPPASARGALELGPGWFCAHEVGCRALGVPRWTRTMAQARKSAMAAAVAARLEARSRCQDRVSGPKTDDYAGRGPGRKKGIRYPQVQRTTPEPKKLGWLVGSEECAELRRAEPTTPSPPMTRRHVMSAERRQQPTFLSGGVGGL